MATNGEVPAGIKSIVDTRAIVGIDKFNGTNEKWQEFLWPFEGTCTNLGLDEAMRQAAGPGITNADISFGILEDEQQRQCKALYVLLKHLVEGKAKTILKTAGNNAGFIAWKMLKEEYEGKDVNRMTSMLTGLLQPNFIELSKKKAFLEVLREWEMAVIDYEEQSNEVLALAQNVLLSVVQGHAPLHERQIIASNSLSIAGNYNKIKEVLTSHKTSSQRYGADGLPVHDSGPQPMDVGSIEENAVGGTQQQKGSWDKNDKYGGKYGKQGYFDKKGKHGGKGYGKFGKNGKKGDKFGKYGKKGDKGGKPGKSNDGKSDSASQVSGAEGTGGSSGGSTYFAGYCGKCWKWGHKRKDCWHKNSQKTAENGCGYIENATEEWESGSDIPDGENVLWCFGIGDNNKPMNKAERKIVAGIEKNNQWLISLDSGSDDHCCMVDFGVGKVVDNGTTLNDVGGDSLGCFGQRNVKYIVEDVDGKDVTCNTDFTVGKLQAGGLEYEQVLQ